MPGRLFALPALIMVCCMAIIACVKEVEHTTVQENYCLPEGMQERIALEPVVLREASGNLSLTGKVDYHRDKVVHFVSLVGGVITNTYFSLGDIVRRGQLLAEIRSTELSSLESSKRILESQLAVAQRQLEAVQSMYEDGIASKRELMEAESQVDVLKSEIQNTDFSLNLYSASSERGVFQIKAPSSGVVVEKMIVPGMQITPGDEVLFTISDLSEVWVILNIYPGNVEQVRQGMEVQIRALAYPGETFTGTIQHLAHVFDTEERVLKARVVMPNKDLRLKPGMLVDVGVRHSSDTMAAVVPTKSLIFDNNQHYLLVYHNPCSIDIRQVDGLKQHNSITFVGSGIEEDEQVITRNHLLIYEQLKNQ